MTDKPSGPHAQQERRRAEHSFLEWWMRAGKFIDPDTEDVPWFDKRQSLAESAWNVAMAQSGNYTANDAVSPTEITFANGRRVWIKDGVLHTDRRQPPEAARDGSDTLAADDKGYMTKLSEQVETSPSSETPEDPQYEMKVLLGWLKIDLDLIDITHKELMDSLARFNEARKLRRDERRERGE